MTEFRTVKRNGRIYRIPIRESQGSSNFIQKSIKHPGRVREYLQRTYGAEAFDDKGRIKPEYLIKAKQKAEEQHNRSLVDAIDLAMRLKKMDSNKDPYGEPKSEATEQARKLREEGEHVRVIETNKKNERYAPFVGEVKAPKGVPANAPTKKVPTEEIEIRDEGERPFIARILGPDPKYHYKREFIQQMKRQDGGSKRHPKYVVYYKGKLPYGAIVETRERAYMVVPKSKRFPDGLRNIATERLDNELEMRKLFKKREETGYEAKIKSSN